MVGRGLVPLSVQPDVCQASLPAPSSVHGSHLLSKLPPASLGHWAGACGAGSSLLSPCGLHQEGWEEEEEDEEEAGRLGTRVPPHWGTYLFLNTAPGLPGTL